MHACKCFKSLLLPWMYPILGNSTCPQFLHGDMLIGRPDYLLAVLIDLVIRD